MNKKGFTLIELLTVIILLALILGITTPVIIDVINGSKKTVTDEEIKLIENAALRYSVENVRGGGDLSCIPVRKLSEEGYLKINNTNVTGVVKKNTNNTYTYDRKGSCS